MRRAAITAMCLLALLVAASPTAASSHHKAPSRCALRHARLITADAQVQVYTAPAGDLFACGYGREFNLGGSNGFSSGGGGELTHFTLAGAVLAFESFGDELRPLPGVREWRIVVRSLRTGKVLHHVPTGTANPSATVVTPDGIQNPKSIGIGPVVSVVVKSDGAAAWIAENDTPERHDPAEYEVHALDSAGGRLLASGSDIDPHSLALAGSTLYWTQGRKPMSSRLD
jgi:hypothetical protein